MLDYCFSMDYVTMDEEGNIQKLKDCPEWLGFKESKDGNILFYAKMGNAQLFIEDQEHFKELKNQIETHENRAARKVYEASPSV